MVVFTLQLLPQRNAAYSQLLFKLNQVLSSVLHIRLACIIATTLRLKYNVHRGVHNTDNETAQKKEKSIVILQGVWWWGLQWSPNSQSFFSHK